MSSSDDERASPEQEIPRDVLEALDAGAVEQMLMDLQGANIVMLDPTPATRRRELEPPDSLLPVSRTPLPPPRDLGPDAPHPRELAGPRPAPEPPPRWIVPLLVAGTFAALLSSGFVVALMVVLAVTGS